MLACRSNGSPAALNDGRAAAEERLFPRAPRGRGPGWAERAAIQAGKCPEAEAGRGVEAEPTHDRAGAEGRGGEILPFHVNQCLRSRPGSTTVARLALTGGRGMMRMRWRGTPRPGLYINSYRNKTMEPRPVSMRIADGPHYLVQAYNLASWVEDQGEDIWWRVNGDPLLMSRVMFPCPADELAPELRKINRPLLVSDPNGAGHGQEVVSDDLSRLLEREELGVPVLYMSWQGDWNDWLLIEDEPLGEPSDGL